MTIPEVILPTRPIDPAIQKLLAGLKQGQNIKITQTVRVGERQWTIDVVGAFRDVNYLATGLSTERVREDDIVVPTVHFTKPNGELSSVALDENTRIALV